MLCRISYTALYVLYLCAAMICTVLYNTYGLVLCFSEHRPCHLLLQQLQQTQTLSIFLHKLMAFYGNLPICSKQNVVFNFQKLMEAHEKPRGSTERKKKSSVSTASQAFQVIGKCFDLYHLKHTAAF